MFYQLAGLLPPALAERRIDAWLAHREHTDALSLVLELWNGRQFVFGSNPSVKLRITTPRALPNLLLPSLNSLGSAYVEGLIDLDGPIDAIIEQATRLAASAGKALSSRVTRLAHSRKLDAESIRFHYDVSNEFYRTWLDEQMVYSCAYFRTKDDTLEQAQINKIDHILRKIRLQPGQRLLDIGCGWGALVLRAAQQFGANCVGVTLSQRQYELASQRVADAGLQDRIEIRLQDYRDVNEKFDRITSVGMFEHVGLKNLRLYFAKINDLLADNGIVMNHGITSCAPNSQGTPLGGGDFIDRYVFPNGELPHIGLALQEMSAAGLEACDIENLRLHYAMTLRHWSQRFEANTGALRDMVGEKRFRVWRAYLAGCAYAFEQSWVALHQIVACKPAGADHHPLPLTREYMYSR
jgi:cyclopropane-fatty-acyl-phospholipid synthase